MALDANITAVAGAAPANGNLPVQLPLTPAQVGSVREFSENDNGLVVGSPYLLSPETTDDFKRRVTLERVYDIEAFNYGAQNTGKHTYTTTTLTAVWTTAGLVTNGTSITTTTTGMTLGTYAEFPVCIGAHSLYLEWEGQISAAVPTNTTIDVGLFRRGVTTAFTPTDGVYFRFNAAGVVGVINYNGAETPTGVFVVAAGGAALALTPNVKYKFIITVNEREVQFWINDVLYAELQTPAAQGQPFMSSTLPFSVRHAIVGGAASGIMQLTVTNYTVSQDNPSEMYQGSALGNIWLGSYQGLSGGTMGSLASYANNANPTAAVPTNTTSALVANALGGQFWETDTLAVNTDGIIMAYAIPSGTVNIQGRRLLIYGIKIDTFVQTALTGGGYNEQWALCFGSTALSLATAEATNTKAPRRKAIGSRTVASGLVALTQLPTITMVWTQPIVVNPAEFLVIAKKKIGTAPSAGVMAHIIDFDYGWE